VLVCQCVCYYCMDVESSGPRGALNVAKCWFVNVFAIIVWT
jgi:hypothetical protein